MAEGMAFDQMKPPITVTDPRHLGLQEWPRHLHKAGVSHDGGPLYIEVQNAEDEAAAIAEGWHVTRAAALAAPADVPLAPPPIRKR
jgi:hypothetical protein